MFDDVTGVFELFLVNLFDLDIMFMVLKKILWLKYCQDKWRP